MGPPDEVSKFDKSEDFVLLDPKKKSDIAERWLKFSSTRVFGQKRFLDIVARALEETGMRTGKPHEPFTSILALGPSQVGKTLTAKVLAEFLFGNRKRLIQINCEDYSEPHAIARLIGSPPGYVQHGNDPVFTQQALDAGAYQAKCEWFLNGLSKKERSDYDGWQRRISSLHRKLSAKETPPHDKAGLYTQLSDLNDKIKELGFPEYNPDYEEYFFVVLFDEIGRGHLALRNLLFTILHEGTLSLTRGDVVQFKNTFVFLTDNAGFREIAEHLRQKGGSRVKMGFEIENKNKTPQQEDQEIYEIAMSAARKTFETAFLNRIQHIVVARPLTRISLRKIFESERKMLEEQFLERGCPILLYISDAVRDAIVADASKNSEENASRLIKKFKSHIGEVLRRLYLTKQIEAGDVIEVVLDSENSKKLIFKKVSRNKKTTLTLPKPST